MAQVIYLHRAIPCAMAQTLTTMELVPVPLVPTCDKKWVYKAVKNSAYEWGWVFRERTRILSGIQFTMHFIDFSVVEAKRFVGNFRTTDPHICLWQRICVCIRAEEPCSGRLGWIIS